MPINNNEYPPYVFREFPKHVQCNGKSVIVQNAAEEAALVADAEDDGDEPASETERQALMAQAKERGLNPHPRTGVDKLKTLLAGE